MKQQVYDAIASYRASQKPPKPRRHMIIIVSVAMIALVAVVLGSAHAIG